MDSYVINFLTKNGLADYIPTFKEARINEKRLYMLDNEFAKELIENSVHRVNFLLSVQELKEKDSDKDNAVCCKKSKLSTEKPETEELEAEDGDINLKMQSIIDPDFVWFKIKRKSPLSEILKDYCKRMGLPEWQFKDPKAKHIFGYKYEFIDGSETPSDLKMKDGDIICIFKNL